MKAKRLMDRVLRYVLWCDDNGWRAVFTREQFSVIYQAVSLNPSIPHEDPMPPLGKVATLFGVEFIVDDTPRPPMPVQ